MTYFNSEPNTDDKVPTRSIIVDDNLKQVNSEEESRRKMKEFIARKDSPVKCSTKGCNKKSVVVIQSYPSHSWEFCCEDHKKGKVRYEPPVILFKGIYEEGEKNG